MKVAPGDVVESAPRESSTHEVVAELLERERQLQVVTDALPGLVSYVDAEQRYRFLSAGYERWFGRSVAELSGEHVEHVVGREAYELIRPHIERALSGDTVELEAEVPYSHGGTRRVAATYVPNVGADGRVAGFVALVMDVTDKSAFERFRVDAMARTEKLLRVTAAIADAVSGPEVFEALVNRVAEAVGASSAGLWLVDDEGKTARLARAHGYSEQTMKQLEVLALDGTKSMPVLDSIRQGRPVWIASQRELLDRYPHVAAMATPGRAYRVACMPLLAHGRVLGTLGLTIEGDGEADEDERDFMLLVARYATQAIERLRLHDAERRSRAAADEAAIRLGVLSRASRAFVEADLDLDARLRAVVAELGAAMASCVALSLLDANGALRIVAHFHPLREAEELLRALAAPPVRIGEGITGAVVASGETIVIPAMTPLEIAARSAPQFRELLARYPVHAVTCTPLRAHGQIMGAVLAARTREGETYTAGDVRLFEELAERAAMAIESSRLHAETLAARARAEQLYRFAQAVVAADRLEAVFDAALAAIEATLHAGRSAILTYGDDEIMRFRAWRHLSDDYRSAVEGHSPWPRDAVAPTTVLVPDVERDPAMSSYVPLFRREGIGALAFVPLLATGTLLGKFMVYYDQPHAFSASDVQTAEKIANHLASVIVRFSAVAKLQETIRYNELFAGVLAHDLRNPLGAILTAAQVVLMRQEGDGAPGIAKAVSRILSSGQRMATMIEQLLDFTRARSGGGIPLTPRETNFADLCTQAVDELEVAHPAWTIHRDFSGDLGGTWDADRLLQVVSNLVANAGQHGVEGSPIRVELDGTAPEHVHLTVRNQGAVPPALLPHLFDPFRSTTHRRDRSRGVGLGLFIVREIIRAHGGTVDVASSEATGTSFSIRLPRHTTKHPARVT